MKSKMEELRRPFPASQVDWMITMTNADKTSGLVVPFITNRAVQERLDEVFGINGWKNEYIPWGEGKVHAQLCVISVWDEEKKEWISKMDGAEDTDIEPVKGGLSAAMKRAASVFGIGRYLYDIEPAWVDIVPRGKSWAIRQGCVPALPAWALPAGEKNPIQSQSAKPDKPSPQPQAQTPTEPERKLTDRQVGRAYTKGRNAGFTEQEVYDMACETYGVPDISWLSRPQYDELCAHLDTFN